MRSLTSQEKETMFVWSVYGASSQVCKEIAEAKMLLKSTNVIKPRKTNRFAVKTRATPAYGTGEIVSNKSWSR